MNQLNELLDELLQSVATIESAMMLMDKLLALGTDNMGPYLTHLSHMAYDAIDEYESLYARYKEIAEARLLSPAVDLSAHLREALHEHIKHFAVDLEEDA